MRGYYIAGTDTEVGKTVVSAGLLKLLGRDREWHYWKPVQSGSLSDDDTATVRELSGAPASAFVEPLHRFRLPLSPHLAARADGVTLDPKRLVAAARAQFGASAPLLVEGAGGLMVPLAERYLQVELVRELGLPVILVVRDRLGAINHTLLSLEVCRNRGIAVEGLLLNRAGDSVGNRETLSEYGDAPILGRFREEADARAAVEAIADCGPLRNLLQG